MNPRRLIIFLALSLVPSVAVGWRIWHGYPGDLFAPNHQLVVRDYLNIWAGGHLAAEGRLGIVFDPHAYAAWLWSVFGTRLDLHTWGYPPHLLLVAIPLAKLGLVPGFLVWITATSAVLWIVLRAGGLPPAYTLAVVLSPAALENALVGQNGAITAAALAGGLLLSQQRQIVAGALLGLLTIKPQLGLLVPVCLLARRDWRTMMWTAIFGSAYCALGLVAFGWDAWRDYLTVTAPFMRSYIDAPFGLAAHFMMVPPYITMRAAGADLAWSYGVQAVASALCAALAWWSWSQRYVDHRLAVAFVLCLAPLTTPYAHSYDLVGVAVACALLLQLEQENRTVQSSECLLLVPAWLWPGSAFNIGTLLVPGLGAFCVCAAASLAGRYLWRASRGQTSEPSGAMPGRGVPMAAVGVAVSPAHSP